jgi:chromate transport protein ChrA
MAGGGLTPATPAAPASAASDHDSAAPEAVSLGQALAWWLRLGFVSFGGPAGQIALMHEELVVRRRWISERRFLHALNYCMVLPGPEAQQLATYIGWLLHRTAGGIAAGSLFVLPSLCILIMLSGIYLAYGHLPVVSGVFSGIKPAVTAIVVSAAFVFQGAVEQHHWLTGAQMIDGLALGETTPGPLIIVVAFVALVAFVAFVGFVGGWTHALFGPDALWAAGAAAAVVVTAFTFLPSFCFILLGGPFIESTHGRLAFNAPLTGITAAVVGVILNLALFFAQHVLWPAGFAGRFEWPAALIGVAAGLALSRWRVGVIPVVLASGLLGLATQLLA